tara:strand:- start:1666 stop:2613 length:948 start_codon:yes stop_codon:yes gene_type:complete
MDNKKPQKKRSGKFICEPCDFFTSNRRDYNRHLLTKKHKKIATWITYEGKKTPVESSKQFICSCGKKYKFCSGLSKHRKKCETYKKIKKEDEEEKMENKIVIEMLKKSKENAELMESLIDQNNQLMQQLVNSQAQTTNYNSYQSYTKNNMTINVFLNEQCGAAMNLTDFVQQLNVSLDDLKYTKEHGYIKGISNILERHLKDIDPKKRPIHCSNQTNLDFYVKDEDKWEKDKPEDSKIDRSIHNITLKQIKSIKEWEKSHPNYLSNEVELAEWHGMIQGVMGAEGEAERDNDNKEIKKKIGTNTEIKDAMLVIKD